MLDEQNGAVLSVKCPVFWKVIPENSRVLHCRARLTLNRCRRLGIFKDFQAGVKLKNMDLEVCHKPRISGPTRSSPNAAEEGYKVQRVKSRFTSPIDKNRKMAVGKCRLFLIAAQLGKHAIVL